jgi:hypothetical protein
MDQTKDQNKETKVLPDVLFGALLLLVTLKEFGFKSDELELVYVENKTGNSGELYMRIKLPEKDADMPIGHYEGSKEEAMKCWNDAHENETVLEFIKDHIQSNTNGYGDMALAMTQMLNISGIEPRSKRKPNLTIVK